MTDAPRLGMMPAFFNIRRFIVSEKNMTVAERLADVREHPERHLHDFEGLQSCCLVDGAISLQLMDAHAAHIDLGRNGGTRCDVIEGPCACGAWHHPEELAARLERAKRQQR